MYSLTILDQKINVIDDLYSLNDLHKSSGGENKHKPSYFMSNQETKEFIQELDNQNINAYCIKQGSKGGTFVCRELVYRYAMWISAKFSLMVIRAFDALNTGAIPCVTPKTTTDDRTPLRQAVSLLVGKKGLAYDEAYNLVHQYMGVKHINEIPLHDLPKAVAYVHSLIFQNHDTIAYNTRNLVWNTMHIYNWYKSVEDAFHALSPHIASRVHDHISDAKANANRLHKLMGFEFDINCPKRLTQY